MRMGGAAKGEEGKQVSLARLALSRCCGLAEKAHVSRDTEEPLDAELGEAFEQELSEINLVLGEVARRRHAGDVVEGSGRWCGRLREASTWLCVLLELCTGGVRVGASNRDVRRAMTKVRQVGRTNVGLQLSRCLQLYSGSTV